MSDPALTVADLESSNSAKPILKKGKKVEFEAPQAKESTLTIGSKLDSEGFFSSYKPASSSDFRWKINSIANRHSQFKQYDLSPCQIFRQRINAYYQRDMKRCTTWEPLEPPSQVLRHTQHK